MSFFKVALPLVRVFKNANENDHKSAAMEGT
jgi:hypothetical protein